MQDKTTKNINGRDVLLKVSREKIKAFDLKHLNLLLDILALLSTAKVKSISELNQFLKESRPDQIEQREETPENNL